MGPNIELASDHPANRGLLTQSDHINLTAYIGHVLDAYRDRTIKRDVAIEEIANLVTAVDTGDLGTFRNITQAGRKRLASL